MKYINHISEFIYFMKNKHLLTLSVMIVVIIFGLSYLVFQVPFVGIPILVLIVILKLVSIVLEYKEYRNKWYGE